MSRVQGTVAVTYSPWAFKEGEQLFENYGQPNHQYFMYHGFTMANNTHDCVNVRIGIPTDAAEEEVKVRWAGCKVEQDFYWWCRAHEPPRLACLFCCACRP